MSIAFFDVDGTLLPHPSLELRFFLNLFRAGKIPAGNYFRWAADIFRQSVPQFAMVTQANKTYLRGVSAGALSEMESQNPRNWVPEIFPAAMQRIWRHSLRGDTIVLVTGTLAPLAEIAKSALERELLLRGVEAQISVIATRLASRDGCWTGRVSGSPMFGQAKAVAVREFAHAREVSLRQCAAYGDHSLDRFMLDAVGNPFAVNPTSGLREIARRNNWPVMSWNPCPRRAATARPALKRKGEVAR
jgi:HAD superfamily hydrolase (TIGR01490 family)